MTRLPAALSYAATFAIGMTGLAAAPGDAAAAPQTFNTALPVAKDQFVFREQFLYREASDDPSSADRELDVLGAVSVLGYGVTGDLAVFGVVPYLDKQLDLTTPAEQQIRRESNGVGDARLLGRYTVFHEDAPGRTFRIAPFAGVELPTGDDDEHDRLGRLPQPLQPGSGSSDPFVGVIATYQTLEFQADAQVRYKANTEANDFEFGDELRLDGSLQYRLWPRQLDAGVPGFLYGVLEANVRHQDENEINGVEDGDSGGTSLSLSPGLQYVTKRWVVEAIVQIPVTQDLNGAALKDDFTLLAGFRFNL